MKAFLLIVLLLSGSVYGQGHWKGLIIDESTPEQAVVKFGQPSSDKTNNRYYPIRYQWFEKDLGKKLRIIRYENIEGFSNVKLGFKNSKLVLIHLEPKEMAESAFTSAYPGVDFRFGSEILVPADFNKTSVNKPTRLPAYHELDGATDKVFILAYIKVGNADLINIVSRTLENKAGADLLR